MKITVAIPVYQQADFLPSALKSIQVQADDIEVTVMDATPDDSVQRVLEHYSDLLSYRRHGPDSGQTSAIQEGWDNSGGEIITWLCADDYYFPNAFDAVRQVFNEYPEVDVVYGDSVFVDEKNSFLGYFPAIKKDISSITKECCISQPSCFVRRRAFEKIGGKLNVNLHYTMDWDLWIRLYKSGARFYFLNKPLSVVRMYEGTKTSSRSWRRFYEIARHLFANTSPFSASRSLLGFFYQDLLTNQANAFDRVMLRLLDCYRNKRAKTNAPADPDKLNYGYLDHSRSVGSEVDIYLPWYGEKNPTQAIVDCDLDDAPIAYLNGSQLNTSQSKYCFEIPDFDSTTYLLNLKLSSPENRSWHLYDVKFV